MAERRFDRFRGRVLFGDLNHQGFLTLLPKPMIKLPTDRHNSRRADELADRSRLRCPQRAAANRA
jgi:hypothetical protein